jgi:hypothetical protein
MTSSFRTFIVVGLAGVAAAASAGCSGAQCNAIIECQNPIVVTAALPSSDAALIEGAQVTFCLNGTCVSSMVTAGAATLGGPFPVDVKVNATDVVFSVQFDGYVADNNHPNVADGDHIQVQILNGASTLIDAKQTVLYTKSSPGCRDGSCYSASVTVTP